MEVDRIVNSFLQSNTFVLSNEGEDDVCLVDIGDLNPVFDLLRGRRVAKLLLTHAHFDHVYGINDLLTSFPKCIVYGSVHTLLALKNDKLNFSHYYETPLYYKGGAECPLIDGQSISLWSDIRINIMITPGHSPGSTCYYTNKEIFTGDSFIPNIATITKLKGGNKSLAEESSRVIERTISDGMRVNPGHLCQYIKLNNRLVSLG